MGIEERNRGFSPPPCPPASPSHLWPGPAPADSSPKCLLLVHGGTKTKPPHFINKAAQKLRYCNNGGHYRNAATTTGGHYLKRVFM
ncbi:hypothetical protein ACOMHN_064401 [Nucella lapillus]